MDTDNDRLLTKENFQQSMMPVFAHTDLANAVFTAFDTDGNDAIDYKEFARYLLFPFISHSVINPFTTEA